MRRVSKWWFARVAPALLSPRAIFWGGISLVVGGVLGFAAQVAFVLLFRALPVFASGLAYGLLDLLFLLRGSVPLLAAVGLVGLYALTTRRPGRFDRLAGVGLGLVLLSCALLVGANLYETVVAPRYIAYGPVEGVPVPRRISIWAGWGWPVGMMLLGVGALGTRGLGRWRALPLALGLLSLPLVSFLLPYGVGSPGAAEIVLDAQPVALSLGWVGLGCLLIRGRGAETIPQTNERLARRLYEEAWGRGELGAIDEIAAPGVVDFYHGGQRGLESFKRSVSGLRVSFPDLRFDLEGQQAEGNLVETRWKASGTDLGGVLWYPPTGRTATFSGTFTDRFEEGRLVEHWGRSDTQSLLRQLGISPDG